MNDMGGWAGAVIAFIGFLSLWLRLRYSVERKVDENTKLTKASGAAAAVNAAAAVATAETIGMKLNGGLQEGIRETIAPMQATLAAHEKDIAEVKAMLKDFVTNSKLQEFSDYIHKRNHDILDAMQTHTNMMKLVLLKLDDKKGE